MLVLEQAATHAIVPRPQWDANQDCCCDLSKVVAGDKVTYAGMRSLVGLGWHEGIMGAWLMFLLASVESRGVHTVPRHISCNGPVAKRQRCSEASTAAGTAPESSSEEDFSLENVMMSELMPISLDASDDNSSSASGSPCKMKAVADDPYFIR